MNKKVKVAKELIKLAKSLVANDTINFVMDNNGNVEEVSQTLFNNIFNAKIAAEQDYFNSSKAVIYVSPVVNANHPTSYAWNKDLIQKTKNWFATLKNKLNHQKIIFDTLSKSEEENEINNRGYNLGCSIVKQKGLFPTTVYFCEKCNKKFNKQQLNGENCPYCDEETKPVTERYKECSYMITVFGASRSEIDKFAETLKSMFDQQSVIVEYGTVSERYVG